MPQPLLAWAADVRQPLKDCRRSWCHGMLVERTYPYSFRAQRFWCVCSKSVLTGAFLLHQLSMPISAHVKSQVKVCSTHMVSRSAQFIRPTPQFRWGSNGRGFSQTCTGSRSALATEQPSLVGVRAPGHKAAARSWQRTGASSSHSLTPSPRRPLLQATIRRPVSRRGDGLSLQACLVPSWSFLDLCRTAAMNTASCGSLVHRSAWDT